MKDDSSELVIRGDIWIGDVLIGTCHDLQMTLAPPCIDEWPNVVLEDILDADLIG